MKKETEVQRLCKRRMEKNLFQQKCLKYSKTNRRIKLYLCFLNIKYVFPRSNLKMEVSFNSARELVNTLIQQTGKLSSLLLVHTSVFILRHIFFPSAMCYENKCRDLARLKTYSNIPLVLDFKTALAKVFMHVSSQLTSSDFPKTFLSFMQNLLSIFI